ncbi:hypothetical protein GCM10020229_76800 [Kitasatospora albolonga]
MWVSRVESGQRGLDQRDGRAAPAAVGAGAGVHFGVDRLARGERGLGLGALGGQLRGQADQVRELLAQPGGQLGRAQPGGRGLGQALGDDPGQALGQAGDGRHLLGGRAVGAPRPVWPPPNGVKPVSSS